MSSDAHCSGYSLSLCNAGFLLFENSLNNFCCHRGRPSGGQICKWLAKPLQQTAGGGSPVLNSTITSISRKLQGVVPFHKLSMNYGKAVTLCRSFPVVLQIIPNAGVFTKLLQESVDRLRYMWILECRNPCEKQILNILFKKNYVPLNMT